MLRVRLPALSLGAALLASGARPAHAQFTLTLAPTKDNTLFEDSLGSVSNGAGPSIFAGLTNRGAIRRGAIAFDLADLPRNASITSVTLTLNNSRSGPASSVPIMLHRFLADWGEGTSNSGDFGGSGAPATTGDATWIHGFHDTVLWQTPGGHFSPTLSAMQTIGDGGGFYSFSSPQLIADVQGWLANPAANFGWAILGDETRFGSAQRFDSRENDIPANRPRLTILYDTIASASTWNIDGGGAWGAAGNWSGGIPDGVGAEARLLDRLTPANAPATITLDANRTLGKLTFDNASSYTLAGPGALLSIDNGSSSAEINVLTGTHTISAPIRIAADTTADIRSALNVTATISVEPARTFVKLGPGALTIVDAGITLGPGARLEARLGDITASHIRGGALEIDDARVHITPGGAPAAASALESLQFDGLGTLDLADNDLVVRATAATRQTILDDLVARIRSARNAPAGRWKGPGLTSSAAEANPLATLAAVPNSGLATFSGQPVNPDDILVKYTWNGDANLDGVINADDYFRIDSGFLAQPADPTYAHGDFNYDQQINADDYFLIDSAFLGQTGPLAHAPIAPIPDPAIAPILSAAFILLRTRRHPRSLRT